MTKFGKLATYGSIETDVTECAVSGQPLGGHMTMQRIKGTNIFYRYISDYQFKLTDELRAELEKQAKQDSNATSDKPDKAKNKSSQNDEVEK